METKTPQAQKVETRAWGVFVLTILFCILGFPALASAYVPFSYTLSYTISPAGFPDVLVRDYNNRRPESMIILKDGVPYGAVYFSFYTFINDNSQPIDGPIPDGDYTFCFPDRVPSGIGVCDFPDGSALADENGRFRIRNGEFHMGWGCAVHCNSSVLFLPGIQGSRLYEELGVGPHYCPPDFLTPGNGCKYDHELWITTSDENHEKLQLNSAGESVNDIYTLNDTKNASGDGKETGLIAETYAGINIYKSFLDDLEDWKTSDGIIEDYAFIPYDWRLSLEDIITNGQVGINNQLSYIEDQDFSESFILQKLQELQETSRTEKVTIVAHSMGGLVAKRLMQELQATNNTLYNQIDKIIFVDVPQVGTPEGLITLLHGIDIGPGGVIMPKERTRQISENMPSVYRLLPSEAYFDSVNSGSPVALFDSSSYYQNAVDQYGTGVGTYAEMKAYLQNAEGRAKPLFEDVNHANTLNSDLILDAEATHNVLDAWVAPPETQIIEITGWGEYTPVGINYRTEKECINTGLKQLGNRQVHECLGYQDKQVLDTVETLKGDGTVVGGSAHYMTNTGKPNTEKWWVDLLEYTNPINLNIPRDHKDILEISELSKFIENKITNSIMPSFDYISPTEPTSTKAYTKIKIDSPVSLDVYDIHGNHTGLGSNNTIEENIPGTRYKTIGESKYVYIPKDATATVKLDGYDEGSFSISITDLEGDTVIDTKTFSTIPSNENTLATLEIPANTNISDLPPLNIDFNGDAIIDTEVDLTETGVYDVTPPEISMYFNFNINEVEFKGIDENPMTTIHSNTSTEATDNQGNTSTLYYTKYKEKPTRLKLIFNTIDRNGVTTTFPNTHVTYDWDTKDGDLIDLDTRVVVKGAEKYVFNYKKKQNITLIKVKTGNTVTTTTRTGFVGVTIKTNGDEVLVNY